MSNFARTRLSVAFSCMLTLLSGFGLGVVTLPKDALNHIPHVLDDIIAFPVLVLAFLSLFKGYWLILPSAACALLNQWRRGVHPATKVLLWFFTAAVAALSWASYLYAEKHPELFRFS